MHSFQRFVYISSKLIPLFLVYLLSKNHSDSKRFLDNAKKIRETFQELGTTYVKLGQMLSARPDIVGPQLSSELRNLLDHEPPIPFAIVEEIIKTELKANPHDVFPTFEEKPIATASIAQVHKAKLKNGKIVAVKVQRPRIAELIQEDLAVLKIVAGLLEKIFPQTSIRFSYIYQEFADWITNEIDFQVEGRRADKFRENMSSLEGIVIPEVYWKYTTQKLLVMQFLNGVTINDLLNEMKKQNVTSLYDLRFDHKLDPDLLIKRLIGAIGKQAFADRYFHGDLHPANILVLPKNGIGFVDFGIVGTLDSQEYMELVLVMLALVENDPESLLKSVVSLMVKPLSQKDTTSLQEVLSLELHKLHEDTGGKISLNHFITTLLSVAQRYEMIWTPGVLLAVKTIGQIDFVSGQIGIKQPLVDLMRPIIEKYITNAISSTVSKEEVFKAALDLFKTGKRLPDTLNDLEELIHSGQFIRVTPPQQIQSQSLFLSLLPVGTSLAISYPLFTQTALSASPYKPILVIVIPVFLFIILSKMMWKREGVK